MTHQWSPEALAQAKVFNKQLLLTAVAVSVDELTATQFNRLRLIVGQMADEAKQSSKEDPYRAFHVEMQGIAAGALSAAHQAVMRIACGIDHAGS